MVADGEPAYADVCVGDDQTTTPLDQDIPFRTNPGTLLT